MILPGLALGIVFWIGIGLGAVCGFGPLLFLILHIDRRDNDNA